MTAAETPPDPMPVTVHFKRNIRSDGELMIMRVSQGRQEINLTRAQALVLAKQIQDRLHE